MFSYNTTNLSGIQPKKGAKGINLIFTGIGMHPYAFLKRKEAKFLQFAPKSVPIDVFHLRDIKNNEPELPVPFLRFGNFQTVNLKSPSSFAPFWRKLYKNLMAFLFKCNTSSFAKLIKCIIHLLVGILPFPFQPFVETPCHTSSEGGRRDRDSNSTTNREPQHNIFDDLRFGFAKIYLYFDIRFNYTMVLLIRK